MHKIVCTHHSPPRLDNEPIGTKLALGTFTEVLQSQLGPPPFTAEKFPAVTQEQTPFQSTKCSCLQN